ncbi:MAG: SpaA isopeptide-forming pilin-related protein, partial [Promicromonosporaceae bacterium]|nr:SpaA isopeptide-forming pilin-related protein [Promicromonosporaceae bacterium]
MIGEALFEDLDLGLYLVQETHTPAGYKTMEPNPFLVTVPLTHTVTSSPIPAVCLENGTETLTSNDWECEAWTLVTYEWAEYDSAALGICLQLDPDDNNAAVDWWLYYDSTDCVAGDNQSTQTWAYISTFVSTLNTYGGVCMIDNFPHPNPYFDEDHCYNPYEYIPGTPSETTSEWNYDIHIYPKNVNETYPSKKSLIAGNVITYTLADQIQLSDGQPLSEGKFVDPLDPKVKFNTGSTTLDFEDDDVIVTGPSATRGEWADDGTEMMVCNIDRFGKFVDDDTPIPDLLTNQLACEAASEVQTFVPGDDYTVDIDGDGVLTIMFTPAGIAKLNAATADGTEFNSTPVTMTFSVTVIADGNIVNTFTPDWDNYVCDEQLEKCSSTTIDKFGGRRVVKSILGTEAVWTDTSYCKDEFGVLYPDVEQEDCVGGSPFGFLIWVEEGTCSDPTRTTQATCEAQAPLDGAGFDIYWCANHPPALTGGPNSAWNEGTCVKLDD